MDENEAGCRFLQRPDEVHPASTLSHVWQDFCWHADPTVCKRIAGRLIQDQRRFFSCHAYT